MAYDIQDAWAQRQAEIEKEREQLKLEQQLKFKKNEFSVSELTNSPVL